MTDELISRQAAIEAVDFGITYAKAIDIETGEVKELFKESNEELTKAAERIKQLPSAQSEMIKEIRRWINSGNRGNADYFIVDRIEEIINAYE